MTIKRLHWFYLYLEYYKRCLFEGILCIGSTAMLPLVYLGYRQYSFFQVARLFRLPMLLDSLRMFVRRVFGSSKKIQKFAVFTLVVLVISAGMFLQLYCGYGLLVESKRNETKTLVAKEEFGFHTFPAAFKSTFQVFMQEAWTEVLSNLLTNEGKVISICWNQTVKS